MFSFHSIGIDISPAMGSTPQHIIRPIEDMLSSSAFESELPMGTPWGIGSTTRAIKRLVVRELSKAEGAPYILLHNVPPSIIERTTDNRQLLGSRAIRLCYNSETRQLIIKFPKEPHEVASRSLGNIFRRAFDTMGLGDKYLSLGSAIADNGRVEKEPDDQWVPKPEYLPAGRNVHWPTVVLECGWSEGLSQLRRDASIWMAHFEAKVAIIVSVERRRHFIQIEKWVPTARHSLRAGPLIQSRCAQRIHIMETKSGLHINGPFLYIEFEELWLRQPAANERDYVFPHATLEVLADDIWVRQDIWLAERNEELEEVSDEDIEIDNEDDDQEESQ